VRIACALVVCFLALTACRSDEEAKVRPEPAVAAPTALVVHGGRLVEIDARTLQPLPGRTARVGNRYGDMDSSPDGARLAVGGQGTVRIVELADLETVAELPKPRGYSMLVSWLDPQRIAVVNEVFSRNRVDVLIIDADSGRLVSRRGLKAREGWPYGAQAVGGDIGFLLHPVKGIGPVRLVHVDRDGRSRIYRLDRIASGHAWVGQVTRDIWPALTLDANGTRAFVVGADDLVADVDLVRGRVLYHALEPSVSLAARLRNWLEPSAEAKTSDFSQPYAIWLGEGRFALYGMQTVPIIEGDRHDEFGEALGFRIVDTADWSVRMVDDEAIWLDRSGDVLLAYGDLWSSVTQDYTGIGLRAYDLDGEELFHALGNRRVQSVSVVGGRALAWLDEDMAAVAVDLRTGRVDPTPLAEGEVPDVVVLPPDEQ
jgi:hypothetical protein